MINIKSLTFALIACTLLMIRCASTKHLHASILDSEGNPVPGAIFYAETSTHATGAFDFVFAVPDEKGELGTKDNPVPIRWSPQAKLSVAAFAPGKKTEVIIDHSNVIIEHGIIFKLESCESDSTIWEPNLLLLSFPFENQPELAKRLTQQKFQLLNKTFLDAYNIFLSGTLQPSEKEKIKVEKIRQLKKAIY